VKHISAVCLSMLVTLLGSIMTGCASRSGALSASMPTTSAPQVTMASSYTDPFTYCAAVKTVDTPDARYTGTPVPDAVINGFKKAAGLEASTEPIEMLRQATVWRCMDGKVYACNFGANLPCDSKANTDRTPSQAMQDYCAANPNSDFIPMSVTGHETVYSWHCVQNKADVLQQIGKVDAAGYLQEIWYEIQPSP
jgi:hypothetical protein